MPDLKQMTDANSTILLIDRDCSGADLLSGYLDGTGYLLERAVDIHQARRLLEADPHRFDVVILDCTVSSPGAPQFLEYLRKQPTLEDVPVILQTGPVGMHMGAEGVEPGEFRCLEKPFDQATLLGVVAVALRERMCFRRFDREGDESGITVESTREATFTFKTIHAARDLAIMLADTCPEPQRAVVGLTELLLNAVEHGNLRISYEEKNRLRHEDRWEEEVAARIADPANIGKEVWVEYLREPGRIRFRIRDQGDGFDWRSYLDVDPARTTDLHGRGIAIARMISFDSIQYRGSGNEVEAVVEIPVR